MLHPVNVTIDDCSAYEQLPFPDPNHRDPFDRMIVVHARGHGLSLVSADPAFDAYGVNRLLVIRGTARQPETK
jgi:PIN domain nuclease of toxin-antitoxin system